MKLYIDDLNAVVCDISEPNNAFWRFSNRVKYFYYSVGHIRRAQLVKTNYRYENYREAGDDYFFLKELIDEAKRCGVEVAQEVEEHLHKLESDWKRLYEEEQAELKALEKRRRWETLCSLGCRSCRNLVCAGDGDFVCSASGDMLDTKNVPRVDAGGVYHFINYEAFPSGNCPKKA